MHLPYEYSDFAYAWRYFLCLKFMVLPVGTYCPFVSFLVICNKLLKSLRDETSCNCFKFIRKITVELFEC